MNWIVFACLSVVFIVTPFQWGLYYESDMRIWEFIVIPLFIMHLLWINFKHSTILNRNTNYFLVFLLPLMYVLTIPFAINPTGNVDSIIRFVTYASFFLMIIWMKESETIRKLLPYVLHLLGIGMLIFAFAELFEVIPMKESMVGCGGERVCGPVRYPNTFAAIIGAFWFYAMAIVVYRKRFDRVGMLLVVMMIGYGVILLHTYSRGGYIFFGVTFGLAFILLWKQWRKFLIVSVASIILSFGMFSLMSMETEKPVEVVPDTFKERVTDMSPSTNTAVARFDFYKQALAMSKDAPWTGFGGESWYIYYPEHEKPGGLNQTHNGYLDLLVEIGWVGLLVFATVCAWLSYQVVRARANAIDKAEGTGVILALMMLFGHSLVDYDFSYGTVWLLVFWLFGIGVRRVESRAQI